MFDKGKILGGVLLVSGTAIGAGMLALPMSTAKNGFILSAVAFLICWFFMTLAALLLLEINLRVPGEKDLISMINTTLGTAGKILAWVLYLLLLYSLICAYLTVSSAWLVKLVEEYFKFILANPLAIVGIALVFGLIISYGTGITEKINRFLALGLVVSYFVLISMALPSVDLAKIGMGKIDSLPYTFPLIITAFGFSVIIPSLTNYFDRNVKVLRFVIIMGGALPLLIYLIWEFVALGIIPLEGSNGLNALAARHENGTGVALALEQIIGNPWITESSRWFAIFAILTSLIGVSLALFHFLADGLQLEPRKGLNRLFLLGITFLPAIGIISFYPYGFDKILSFAGIFVAILLGIIPALMAWRSRYYLHASIRSYRVFGGKPLLIGVMIFFAYVVYLEITNCLVCQ